VLSATTSAQAPALRVQLAIRALSSSSSSSKIVVEDRQQIEARQALAAGNTAEAYGLSPEAGAIGDGGIIEKYGLVPLLGLGLAAALSKEVLLLNEEILVAICFGSFVFSGYTALGSSVGEGLDAEINEIRAEQEAVYVAQADNIRACIEAHRANINVAEEAEAVLGEYRTLVDRLVTTRGVQFKTEVNQLFEEKLQDIATAEARVLQGFVDSAAGNASAFVADKFEKANAKTKDDLLNAALAVLAGGQQKASPVRVAFKEYFQGLRERHAAAVAKSHKLPADLVASNNEETARLAQRAAKLGIENVKVSVADQAKLIY
jgi:hypothetical protein